MPDSPALRPSVRPLPPTLLVSPMCGICGIALSDPGRPVDIDRLHGMNSLLEHRGPDGAGLHRAGPVGLGHRRLSIIDIEGGRQPLANEDGSVWVTFNGEIYNYLALRDELVARGHRFATRSDTEVLVHGYEEFGPDLVRRLNGMFAFAIHDAAAGRVVLARDHFGIKPLFYATTDEGLFFASEIKSVVAGARIASRARADALQEYLLFRYAAGSRSLYQDVHRLPPAHVAVWERGTLTTRRYWRPPAPARDGRPSVEIAAAAFRERLSGAVAAQLMSEVPLGTFCSGGIDSGLVTAFAAERRTETLRSFSVGFDEAAWDESALARDTAARHGTLHHEIVARPADFAAELPRLLRFSDEPLNHANAVPLYLLARRAREEVTVVLTGEGSDELFCGYPRFQIARAQRLADALPASMRSLAGSVLSRLPGHRAALAGRLLALPLVDGLVLNSAYLAPALVERLTGSPIDGALAERRALAAEMLVDGDAVSSLSRYELATYVGSMLDRNDRMTMAVGLEARVPFLDVPLVEWGARLAPQLKLRGRETKRVVKRAAEGMLSERITRGRKSGFGVPLDAWFRSPAFAPLVDRLRDPVHPGADLVDGALVSRMAAEHQKGLAAHGQALWALLNVYLWAESLGGVAAPPSRRPDADVVVLEPLVDVGGAVDRGEV